jgi:hypothetical protein
LDARRGILLGDAAQIVKGKIGRCFLQKRFEGDIGVNLDELLRFLQNNADAGRKIVSVSCHDLPPGRHAALQHSVDQFGGEPPQQPDHLWDTGTGQKTLSLSGAGSFVGHGGLRGQGITLIRL